MKLWTTCPWADDLTDYDKKNLSLFALLLEAESEGASDFDMAACFFSVDAKSRPDRALKIVRSHLARARWLKDKVFPYLSW